MSNKILFIVFNVLQLADKLLTYTGLCMGILVEKNTLILLIIGSLGEGYTLALMGMIGCILSTVLYMIAPRVLYLVTGVYIVITAVHFIGFMEYFYYGL
jgi:hypothetical protein